MVVQETLPPAEGSRATGKHEKKHRLKQRFEVVKKLGQGTYGKVQLAINKETSQEVAIKTIKKSKIESEQDLIRIRREIQIMSSIQHPHIIHIYEVFENKDKIVLVMQYASGGELYDYLSEKKILSDTEARQIFRQVAAAVYYCHKNKICHRDLKLENVLLDEKGNAKIADFGLSNVYDEKHLLDTFCGSPLYASPEIVKGVPYYGPEVDCWSMGVILYTLVYGAMPFDGSNFKRLVKQISEGDYYEPAKKAEASQLIHRLLHVNPAKRATIIDICTDSWVNEGYEHSLLQVSEDLANLTPVRIDLLLALAPTTPAANEEKEMQHPLAENNNKRCDKLQEEHDDDTETATDSFAYIEGGTESHRSASFPNLPNLDDTMDGDEEFLPAAVAAELEGQYSKRQAERSFDGSLAKVSSIVHKTKKPRKSSSVDNTQSAENKEITTKTENISSETEKDQNNNDNISKNNVESTESPKKKDEENISTKEVNKEESKETETNEKSEINKPTAKRRQSTELNKTNKEKVSAPGGRVPGKITIPKFLESPESSPTKIPEKKFPSGHSESKLETDEQNTKSDTDTSKPSCASVEKEEKQPEKDTIAANNTESTVKSTEKQQEENKNADLTESNDANSEDKKFAAKGILKKNIAKARLLEKRLSQQSSVESDTGPASPPSGQSQVSPTLSCENSDVSKGPSFFKVPQPYSKNIKDKPVESKAEIVFASNQEQEKSVVSLSSQSSHEETESIWGTPLSPPIKADSNSKSVSKHVGWNNALPNFKNGADGWKQQVEESLLRLSPEEEEDFPSGKQIGPTPISRSYKKFTFTKEGTCITETGKIYTKPGADGSWTKVEKKTKITTLPGNDEFQKFEHVQVRDESNLSRSDSQSSSGSNDVFDDIFDSWTGDSMMCNFMKVKDNIRKFARGPLLWRDRQRDPFKQFFNPQTNVREAVKHSERWSNQSSEWESDNEEFEDMQPVVYGSQGLWQLMRSVNKDLPHHLRSFRDSPRLGNYARSVSHDRGSVTGKQSHYATRPNSGYNTRSLSRERSQSPKETVLRFVVESPQRQQSITTTDSPSSSVQELWHSKMNTPSVAERRCRKDSGVESCTSSDSEATRQLPSRMSSRDEETGYTSFDGAFGPRTYRQYIKSFSKPSSERQRSLEEPYAQSPFDNSADSRRHRVEQWLHMADVDGFDSPFEEIARQHDLLAQYENPGSTIYGTMRPRGFMKYNRTMSDKMSDSECPSATTLGNKAQTEHSSEEQTKSYRSEINVENMGKVQSSTYKTADYNTDRISHPVGGGSYRMQQCDSAETAAKQTTSNQSNSPNIRYTRSYSGNLQYAGPQDKGQSRPILSMTVSFNRGGAEGPVVVRSNTSRPSGYSGGIWQQQEFSSPGKVTIRREFSDPSSESAHANVSHRIYSVGGENVSGYSFQETDRCSTGNYGQSRGKNDCLVLCSNNAAQKTACSDWCNRNTNRHVLEPSCKLENNNLSHIVEEDEIPEFRDGENTTDVSDGTLTPDSLETSSLKDEGGLHAEEKPKKLLRNSNTDIIDEIAIVGIDRTKQLFVTERNEVTIRLNRLIERSNNLPIKSSFNKYSNHMDILSSNGISESTKNHNISSDITNSSLNKKFIDNQQDESSAFMQPANFKYDIAALSQIEKNFCKEPVGSCDISSIHQLSNEQCQTDAPFFKSVEWSNFDLDTEHMLSIMNKLKRS